MLKPEKLSFDKAMASMGNAPDTAFERVQHEWAELHGSRTVDKARFFVLAIVFALVSGALALTIWRMAPLKQTVPYIVEVNKEGKVTGQPLEATRYAPGSKERKFFVADFVRKILEIDKAFTERSLTEAFSLTRNAAIQEFKDLVEREQPLKRLIALPALTRKVDIQSVAFVQEKDFEGVAYVTCSTEEREANKAPLTQKLKVVIHYAISPPLTEAEVFRNPLGLFVTHFAINEEAVK